MSNLPRPRRQHTFTSSITCSSYKVLDKEALTCSATSIVYLIRHCCIQYVGETGQPLRNRMSNHRASIKNPQPQPLYKYFNSDKLRRINILYGITETVITRRSSMYRIVLLNFLAINILLFIKPLMYLYSYENRNRLASNGAQSVPIGMPTHCWYTLFPTLTNTIYKVFHI